MNWFVGYYVVCLIYCYYQLYKNLSKRYNNSPSSNSPEMDAIMVLIMAWVLAPVDVVLTWIRWVKEAEESTNSNIRVYIQKNDQQDKQRERAFQEHWSRNFFAIFWYSI